MLKLIWLLWATVGLTPSQLAVQQLQKARIYRLQNNLTMAAVALQATIDEPQIAELVQLEQGLLAQHQAEHDKVIDYLWPLVNADLSMQRRVIVPLAQALAVNRPHELLIHVGHWQSLLAIDDIEGKALLDVAHADALLRLRQLVAAKQVQLHQYLTKPQALSTPATPPYLNLTAKLWLERAQNCLNTHQLRLALVALAEIHEPKMLAKAYYLTGLVHRRLHDYAQAKAVLLQAQAICHQGQEEGLLCQKIDYLQIKVLTIAEGLRALDAIEHFAKNYPESTMVDDVLFFAGDMLERRGQDIEAARYYNRIVEALQQDDYCAEAQFRLGFMAFKRQKYHDAQVFLTRHLQRDRCVKTPAILARAAYWLGKAQEANNLSEAALSYGLSIQLEPHGFYAQALRAEHQVAKPYFDSQPKGLPSFCQPTPLDRISLKRNTYFRLGLVDDAKMILAAQAVNALRPSARQLFNADDLQQCLPQAVKVFNYLQWLIATQAYAIAVNKVELLWRLQTKAEWQIAYPPAYQDLVVAAEREFKLPQFLLQAIMREESRFDNQAVSWANAYGLVQLMLPTARHLNHRLQLAYNLDSADALFDPVIALRLGAAALAQSLRRLKQHVILAIAGYNAGTENALAWQRQNHQPSWPYFIETIPFSETKAYVKRVLQTMGIYYWLSSSNDAEFALGPVLPVPVNSN